MDRPKLQASTAEVNLSKEDSSSVSGSESDNEDVYKEAREELSTEEATLRWIQRNKQRFREASTRFAHSCAESDNEDVYKEAREKLSTEEATSRWIQRYKQRCRENRQMMESNSEDYSSSSDNSSYDKNTSGDEEDKPATKGEDIIAMET